MKKWELAIQSGMKHIRMKRAKRNVQKEDKANTESQQKLSTPTPIDKQTDIISNHEKTKSMIQRKALRYVVLALVAIGIITGIVFGIIYIINDYIPEKKLDKAVDEIIYNFENGDKETKRNYAEWILSTDHNWGYEDVSNYRIRDRFIWYKDEYRKKAFDYVESMAYKGDIECQFLLGLFYNGNQSARYPAYTTETDMAKSIYWFHEAAKQNHPVACNFVGIAYQAGKGVEANMTKAVEWLRKGAELGDPYAQVNYGDMLVKGVYDDRYWPVITILPKNIEEARFWWRKAAAQGDKRAKDRLQTLYE